MPFRVHRIAPYFLSKEIQVFSFYASVNISDASGIISRSPVKCGGGFPKLIGMHMHPYGSAFPVAVFTPHPFSYSPFHVENPARGRGERGLGGWGQIFDLIKILPTKVKKNLIRLILQAKPSGRVR